MGNSSFRSLFIYRNDLLRQVDLIVNVCDHYHRGVFQQRNIWMVDHSRRVIAAL